MHPAGLAVAAATAALASLLAIGRKRQARRQAEGGNGAPKSKPTGDGVVRLEANSLADPGALQTPLGGTPPLLQLHAALCRAFAEEKGRGHVIDNAQPAESFQRLDAAVRGLVGEYVAAGHADWQRYANFSDLHYVRNLVEENDDFEVMVICWKHGQGSRVHNHASSHGWVTVLAGQVTEDQYELVGSSASGDRQAAPPPGLPGVLGASAPCPELVPLSSATAGKGATLYINDRQALHAVRCSPGSPGIGAVTLHIYAPPIRRVKLYEPDNDRVIERRPGFFTVRGQKA